MQVLEKVNPGAFGLVLRNHYLEGCQHKFGLKNSTKIFLAENSYSYLFPILLIHIGLNPRY